MLEVRPFDLERARHVYEGLRPSDRLELESIGNRRADEFADRTEAYIGFKDGEPVAVFGIAVISDYVAQCWLWGNDELNNHLRLGTKLCRKVIPIWAAQYWDKQLQIVGSPENAGWFRLLGFEPTNRHFRGLQIFTYTNGLNTRN